MTRVKMVALSFALGTALAGSGHATEHVYLTEAPDYEWHLGCFGTASGNLIGYWDRHGLPDFYTGPTAGGVAPLDSRGSNFGIRSLWASRAGQDGRPANRPGHEDDYYVAYESTDPDPYLTAHRTEHEPDCIGDFIGLNQNKWKNLNGECDGNLDGYSFVYWDHAGARRENFTPGPEAGLPPIDMQSGLRAWARYRGYGATVFSQLTDFNPNVPTGKGFTFADLRAEIDAGYPVLLFMQNFQSNSRAFPGISRANPSIHGMLAYGYLITDDGTEYVRYRTSWASGDLQFNTWTADNWTPEGQLLLPLRGVLGFHPLPKITSVRRQGGRLRLQWDGPASVLYDVESGALIDTHWYVVEKADSLTSPQFVPVSSVGTAREADLPEPPGSAFYRVRLVPRPR